MQFSMLVFTNAIYNICIAFSNINNANQVQYQKHFGSLIIVLLQVPIVMNKIIVTQFMVGKVLLKLWLKNYVCT